MLGPLSISLFLYILIWVSVNDEEGLDDVEQELEAKAVAPFISDRCVFYHCPVTTL